MMSNSSLNPLIQIKTLINEINDYISKINDIITQVNDIVNQNQSQNESYNYNINFDSIRQKIHKRKNYMNKIEFRQISNDLGSNYYSDEISSSKNWLNIKFLHLSGHFTYISIDGNRTMNELFNLYCEKNDRFDLVNNYDKHFEFIYNVNKLNNFKNKKIFDIIKGKSTITVLEKS